LSKKIFRHKIKFRKNFPGELKKREKKFQDKKLSGKNCQTETKFCRTFFTLQKKYRKLLDEKRGRFFPNIFFKLKIIRVLYNFLSNGLRHIFIKKKCIPLKILGFICFFSVVFHI
jgi:hypothetical protein